MSRRPLVLSSLTYSTYGPVLSSVELIRRPLAALADAVDQLEGAISHDEPSQAAIDAALRAYEQLPALLASFEAAVAPRHVETLARRLARIRGVSAEEFGRRRRRRSS